MPAMTFTTKFGIQNNNKLISRREIMKVRYLGILLLGFLTLFSCDDNTGKLGMGMLPDSDRINVETTSFDVTTQSYFVEDGVYAKTNIGYIGKFTDPALNGIGDYEASFITELNCTDDFRFPAVYDPEKHTGTMAGDTVVSIQLAVYYKKSFGDTLNACRMSVYELNDKWLDERKSADRSYRYTNIDPDKYYDKKDLLGRKAYTAYDTSVPDSVRYATDSNGSPIYYPNVTFPLDKEWGNEILQLNRAYQRGENDYFKNSEKFIEHILKGLYFKTDYGDGTVLYVDQVNLQMQFRFHYVDSLGVKLSKKDGSDSLYYSMATVFASTKEVIQANQLKNAKSLKELAEKHTDLTYLRSPAGIFTEATLPYDEIHEKLAGDTLNAVKLTFTNYNEDANKYEFTMGAPETVLLLRKKDLKSFFEENKVPDNITSFSVDHNNVATNQYTFMNIARLITTCINEKKAEKIKAGAAWDEKREKQWIEDNKVLLIPVSATYELSNNTKKLIGIQHNLAPSYARLKGGPATENGAEDGKVKTPLKLEVIYTTFNE